MDNVILQKAASLERCVRRVHEDFDHEFEENLTKQDAVIFRIYIGKELSRRLVKNQIKE